MPFSPKYKKISLKISYTLFGTCNLVKNDLYIRIMMHVFILNRKIFSNFSFLTYFFDISLPALCPNRKKISTEHMFIDTDQEKICDQYQSLFSRILKPKGKFLSIFPIKRDSIIFFYKLFTKLFMF